MKLRRSTILCAIGPPIVIGSFVLFTVFRDGESASPVASRISTRTRSVARTSTAVPRPIGDDRTRLHATVGEAYYGLSDGIVPTGDVFAFVQAYAPRAYGGDARAAYYVGEAAKFCYVALDPRTSEGLPPDPSAQACERFATEDAYATLPPRAGGYPWTYWHDGAILAGDPLARLAHAITRSDASPIARRAAFRAAAESGDPEAQLMLGQYLASRGGDPVEGLTWQLRACDAGLDCRTDNPQIGHGCVASGACASGTALIDLLRDLYGDQAVAEARARAGEL